MFFNDLVFTRPLSYHLGLQAGYLRTGIILVESLIRMYTVVHKAVGNYADLYAFQSLVPVQVAQYV